MATEYYYIRKLKNLQCNFRAGDPDHEVHPVAPHLDLRDERRGLGAPLVAVLDGDVPVDDLKISVDRR